MCAERHTVFIVHGAEERWLLNELREQLTTDPKLSVWDSRSRSLPVSSDVSDANLDIGSKLRSAEVIVVLVGPSLLTTKRGRQVLDAVIERGVNGGVHVIPVLARPCRRERRLNDFVWLPHDGRPVSMRKRHERDKIWAAVAAAVKTNIDSMATCATRDNNIVLVPILEIGKIFPTSGQPEITFVEPAQLFRLRADLKMMGQSLVVEGPSGVGKTTVVKHILATQTEIPQEWLLAQNLRDLMVLDERLTNGLSPGHLIIDDFHRLDRTRRARVADAMKIVADRDFRTRKISVIGINPAGESLISTLGELSGRVTVVPMRRQPDDRIIELIQKGESAANITFLHREEFVNAAGGSFFAAQQLCYEAVLAAGISRTAATLTQIDVRLRDVIGNVLGALDARFFGMLRNLVCNDKEAPPRGAMLALLWLLRDNVDGHATFEDVYYQFDDSVIRDALPSFKDGLLASSFDRYPDLRNLFYYNEQAGALSIEDPRLAFYLNHMPWTTFIERTGHKRAFINSTGKLDFRVSSYTHPRRQNIVQTTNIIHLSDLHFSEPNQAEQWHERLIKDLKDMKVDHIDALVISGDLTQSAKPAEFEIARQFLLRVSVSVSLPPDRVVIVPGNHDLDWELSREAYELQRRDQQRRALPQGTYIDLEGEFIYARLENKYNNRFSAFADFYYKIEHTRYSLVPGEQYELQDYADLNLLFVGLNSSWEIDHHYRHRAGINEEALMQALARIKAQPEYAGRIKIAVLHHPLDGPVEDRIHDQAFLQHLVKANFRLVLHGHVHGFENRLSHYEDGNESGRRIDIVSAGTFGAPSRDWIPGYPLKYNLLRFSPGHVAVEARHREHLDDDWQPPTDIRHIDLR